MHSWGVFWCIFFCAWRSFTRSILSWRIAMVMVALLSGACAATPLRPKLPDPCDQVEYLGDIPGYPVRLPGRTGILADDYRPLPSSADVSWFAPAPRGQQRWIGQPLPIRSPWFGGARPQCAPNPDWAVAVQQERQAEQAGFEVGEKYGEVLGRIEAGIQMMQAWPHHGVALQRILSNPEERDALLRSVAKDLDEVPELPTYSDDALARKALAGFQRGYHDGMVEAHRRAFLVNVGVDVYFMAIGGIAGALESAGAKLLDQALMRVRAMPIFVPGAVGGVGFFIKSLPRIVQGSSRRLLKNMLAAGKKPLNGEVPHHIVAHTDGRALEARKILNKFDVKIDDDPNGVFLPGTMQAPNPKGKAVHSTVHTDRYYLLVESELKAATTKQEVIRILEDLGVRLEKGGL